MALTKSLPRTQGGRIVNFKRAVSRRLVGDWTQAPRQQMLIAMIFLVAALSARAAAAEGNAKDNVSPQLVRRLLNPGHRQYSPCAPCLGILQRQDCYNIIPIPCPCLSDLVNCIYAKNSTCCTSEISELCAWVARAFAAQCSNSSASSVTIQT